MYTMFLKRKGAVELFHGLYPSQEGTSILCSGFKQQQPHNLFLLLEASFPWPPTLRIVLASLPLLYKVSIFFAFRAFPALHLFSQWKNPPPSPGAPAAITMPPGHQPSLGPRVTKSL